MAQNGTVKNTKYNIGDIMEKSIKEKLERIVHLKESEVGFKEENVKFKIIIPLLELLGHKKENLDLEYGTKEGEVVSGVVQKVERGNVYVDFNRATGILPTEEQIPGEYWQR